MKKLLLLLLLLFAPYASAQGPFSAQIVRYGNQFHLKSAGAPYTCNSITFGHEYSDTSDTIKYFCNGSSWLATATSGGSGILPIANGGTAHSSLTASTTASSHAFTCNFATAKQCVVTLQGSGADTATFSGPVRGEVYTVILIQPSGSDGTVTWPATVYWPGGVAPTLTTTDSTCDIIMFAYNGVGYKGEYSLNYAAAGCTQ